jgi:hypothetical protein
MKKKFVLFSSAIVLAMILFIINGCKKDEETFNLDSIVAGSVDLNTSTTPVDVPTDAPITATFSSDVDAATATTATITLTRNYDDASVAITIAVTGKTITVTPDEAMASGAQFTLNLMGGIMGTNGKALTATNRTFQTAGSFAPSGMFAYWNFDDNPNEQISGAAPIGIVNVSYVDSYSSKLGKAASFDGTTSIMEFANGDALDNTNDFTLSFWVKAQSAGHVDGSGNPKGHFVMGLGAFYGFQFEITGDYSWCKLAAQYAYGDGTSGAEDLWFPGDGVTGQNGGWQGWTFCKDLTGSGGVAGLIKDKWANVVCVYNSSTREAIMYINGEEMKAFDFDLWPVGDPKTTVTGMKWGGNAPDVLPELAFGFIQSRGGTLWDTEPWGGYDIPTANHFGGLLDDVRIFHKVLTADEIGLMYSSAK